MSGFNKDVVILKLLKRWKEIFFMHIYNGQDNILLMCYRARKPMEVQTNTEKDIQLKQR